MISFYKNILITISIGLLFCACTPFAPEQRATFKNEFPETYSSFAETASPRDRWWEAFNDSQLNQLIEEALARN